MKDQVDGAGGERRPGGSLQQRARQPTKRRGSSRRCDKAAIACSTCPRAAGRRGGRWFRRAARRSVRSRPWPWTKPTASASGATISGRSTASCGGCASGSPACRCTPTRRQRPPASGGTSSTQLGLRDPIELVGSFDRPNLVYRVLPRAGFKKQLLEVIARHRGEAGIVYCTSRREVDELAEWLSHEGTPALPYHAGLSDRERGATTRTPSSASGCKSWWPRWRSAWASTARTCASWCTRGRRGRWSTTSRSPGARAATAWKRSACSSTRPPTSCAGR